MTIRFLALFLAITLGLSACQGTANPETAAFDAKKAELRKIANNAKISGNTTLAAHLDSQIIALDEKNPNTFIDLAKTLQKQQNSKQALEVLQLGEKLLPQDEKLKLAVAQSMADNKQAGEAITKLKTINTAKNKDYYNTLGVAQDMTGNHKEAQDSFRRGLETAPDDATLKNNLALSYIFEGKYDNGIDILEKLIKLEPKPKYRQNLALAYGLQGKNDEARKLLIKDMSKKEAEENLKTYQQMRKEKGE